MKIGTQLKKTRLFMGLAQEHFSAGVVSENFYSRVENNKNDIKMKDLIQLLKNNDISLYDFFEPILQEEMQYNGLVNKNSIEILNKLISKYQLALKGNDEEQMHRIEKIFELTGYQKYYKNLR